jgi:FG-GAP repeat
VASGACTGAGLASQRYYAPSTTGARASVVPGNALDLCGRRSVEVPPSAGGLRPCPRMRSGVPGRHYSRDLLSAATSADACPSDSGPSLSEFPTSSPGFPNSSRKRVATGCGWLRLVAAKCPRPRENSEDPWDLARTWTNLKASNTSAGDLFGRSVALSGDTLAVAAPGEDSATQGVGGNQDDDSALYSGVVYIFH